VSVSRPGDSGRPSASCLYYLFADRVVRRLTWWQRLSGEYAVVSPSSGSLVGLGVLERRLLAVAIWRLHASRRIRISWAPPGDNQFSPSRFGGLRGGTYELRFHRGRGFGVLSGLEADLLGALRADGADTYGLVNEDWLQQGPLPISGVIAPVQREALALGVLLSGEAIRSRRRSLQWSEGLPDLRADHQRLMVLEEPFNELVESLESLVGSERKLWSRIASECGKALAEARPTPLPGSSGG
jgi:hypothetical protein